MKKLFAFAVLLFSMNCASTQQRSVANADVITPTETKPTTPKTIENTQITKPLNIIVMIGDGMGLSQISTLDYIDVENIAFDRFPTVGLLKTSSGGQRITDSAAGATVYSAGVRTYNGAIGVDIDTVAVESILEKLETKGYNSGLVATSSITHATPASFYAHQKSRNMTEEIADDLAKSQVDFFAGGGIQFFTKRKDGRNLIAEMSQKGFAMDTTSLAAADLSADKVGILLAPDGMPKMLDGRGDFLPDATMKCIDFLSKKEDPFFMLVEGSQIDWGGHANDGPYMATELVDFNNTINAVLDWAEKDQNTIVIVTADHECGGFSLSAKTVFGKADYNIIDYAFTTTGHTGTMVPVYAFGPKNELFNGTFKNSAIYGKIMSILTE